MACFLILAGCGEKKSAETSGPTEAGDSSEAVEAVGSTAVAPGFFEMRTYYCPPGKLDGLLARFRNHTMRLFEKHGMTNMGYWVPVENTDNKLVYLMGYPDRAARDRSWDAFRNDPAWLSAKEASEANGALVDSVVSKFYSYTDYSPQLEPGDSGPRIFALRTYFTNPGKLANLNQRFRDHTLELFERAGIHNVAYFTLEPDQPGADHILTYLVSFPDTAARTQSWRKFIADPDWQAVAEASNREGQIIDSIADEALLATDFSPIK